MRSTTGDEVFLLTRVAKDSRVLKLFCDPIYDDPQDKLFDDELGDVTPGRGRVIGFGGVPYSTNVLFTRRGGTYIRDSDLSLILRGDDGG